jgi:hypothetical protein
MPITEQERQQLRDRLKAAREAKAAKQAKKVPAADEQAQEPPPAPVIAPTPKPVNDLLAELDAYQPPPKKTVPKEPKEPEPKPKDKEKKKKYAKLVFYEAPTDKKQLKQLARALGGNAGLSSDEEEDKPPAQKVWTRPRHEPLSEPAPAPTPVPQEDPRQARMKKLNQMSRMFFD